MEKENLMEKQTTNKRCLLFGLETRELEIDGEEKKELWVEGRAVSFNSPTVLFEIGETQYKEQIDSRAFEETNLSDVIFNYNHGGKVLARTRNKTLVVDVREDGVYIRARLDGTEELYLGFINWNAVRFHEKRSRTYVLWKMAGFF